MGTCRPSPATVTRHGVTVPGEDGRRAIETATEGATMTFVPTGKVWSADELFALTPNERHDVIQASIVTDIDAVPRDLLEQAQADIRRHIADVESAPPNAP